MSAVALRKLPSTCTLSIFQRLVNRVDVSGRRNVNPVKTTCCSFVSAAKFFQFSPVSQELFFRSVFRQYKPIGRVATANCNSGDN